MIDVDKVNGSSYFTLAVNKKSPRKINVFAVMNLT